jgi:hypothetical protein
MRIGKENWSTGIQPGPVPIHPPQIPHILSSGRTWEAGDCSNRILLHFGEIYCRHLKDRRVSRSRYICTSVHVVRFKKIVIFEHGGHFVGCVDCRMDLTRREVEWIGSFRVVLYLSLLVSAVYNCWAVAWLITWFVSLYKRIEVLCPSLAFLT